MEEKIDYLLFQDESMIRDYQGIHRTWFQKGRQRITPTYGKHCGTKLFGCLDYASGEILCSEKEHYDATSFLEFLVFVLEYYPVGKIVMILDNARIHHAKLIQPFLEENKGRLELVFLPPYSPNLNLIEGLWKWLKETVINNVFFSSVQKINLAVQSFLTWINEQREIVIDRLCVKM